MKWISLRARPAAVALAALLLLEQQVGALLEPDFEQQLELHQERPLRQRDNNNQEQQVSPAAANQWPAHLGQLPSGGGGGELFDEPALKASAMDTASLQLAEQPQQRAARQTSPAGNNNNNINNNADAELMIYEPAELAEQQHRQRQQFHLERRARRAATSRLARQRQHDYAMEAALAELDAAAGAAAGTSDELLQFEASVLANQQRQQQARQLQQRDDGAVGPSAAALISHQEAGAEQLNSMSSSGAEQEQEREPAHDRGQIHEPARLDGNLEKFDAHAPTMEPPQSAGLPANNGQPPLAANEPQQAANGSEPSAEPDRKPAASRPRAANTRLAQFIRSHLLGAREAPKSEQERTREIADDFGKLYRVLSVTSKWAGTGAGQPARKSAQLVGPAGESAGEQQPAVSGRQLSQRDDRDEGPKGAGGLLVGRLVKKTDWNALFVKLAKVFLQYFLDMILNDMFGTTGASRSFVSSEIDLRKTLKDFLRFASGLERTA